MTQYDWRTLVTTAADYEVRATQHRPTEHEVLLREVLRLRAHGLMPRDIALALGLDEHDVAGIITGAADGTA